MCPIAKRQSKCGNLGLSACEIVEHTPVKTIVLHGSTILTDTFSTQCDGEKIGDQSFVIVDPETGKFEIMLDKGKYERAVAYLPYDVYKNMEKYAEFKKKGTKCNVSVSSQDSLEAAKEMLDSTVGGRIAVLNFANPLSPGGGVRRDAKAQEETLCLRSSLLKSLESMDANKYYEYNHEHRTFAGSDAIVLSENVEVIKDSNYKFLEKGFLVSVISCAASMVSPFTHRLEDTTDEQMEFLLYRRIVGVLTTLICHINTERYL